MNDALYIGATGMQAQQVQLDAIANNLANLNTPAYKRSRVSFGEIVQRAQPSSQTAAADGAIANSAGVMLASTSKLFEPGELKKTDSPMDVAIQGEGFLELAMPDGTRAFTRGGTLKVNADGQLSTQSGAPLKPGFLVPENTDGVVIAANGRVQVRVAGQARWTDAGQLELVRFPNVQGLLAQAGNVYRSTEASGEPIAGRPGEDGFGSIAQGSLEASNVKLVDELIQLMVAQRGYEASVKVVQASDEILGLINGMRR
jgi:flagellar basal-body rod protein FlgG